MLCHNPAQNMQHLKRKQNQSVQHAVSMAGYQVVLQHQEQ